VAIFYLGDGLRLIELNSGWVQLYNYECDRGVRQGYLFRLLTPKGPWVFWGKTTLNYSLLKKGLVIIF
jgi:hypothetical protein